MKKYLILGFALLMLSARLPAQTGAVGNLTAQSTNCLTTNACLEVDIPPTSGGATLKISGTFSATVQFEATADPLTVLPSAANWVAISSTPSSSSTTATSATSGGVWQVNIAAYRRIRLRVSTYASGTVAAAINLSTASARGGSGGGGSGGGGTPALPFNSVQFNAAGSFGGSANLTYANTGGSCTLTPAATFTQCGTAAGSFKSSPSLYESITNDNTSWNAIFSNTTGTGNTGTTRKTFLAIASQGSAIGDDAEINYYSNDTQLAGIEFGNGTTALTVGSVGKITEVGSFGASDPNAVSEIKTIPDGDVQVLAPAGFGLCLEGSTSGQGCLKVDATSTKISSSLPVQVGPDGVHPGMVSLVGNTTLPTLPANTANIIGSPAATQTSWSLQLPTAIPANGHLFTCTVSSTNCLLTDGGAVPTGTVSSIGTTSPITGGTITTTGTIACATCVTSAASLSSSLLVAGTGGQTVAQQTWLATQGTNELDIGGVGNGNAILGLLGTTSGTATFTAPAVAGTTTNAVTSSNDLKAPRVVSSTHLDVNGNVFLASSATASAVDSVTITNAATANPATVTIGATGTDTNINLAFTAKGTGVAGPGALTAYTQAAAAIPAGTQFAPIAGGMALQGTQAGTQMTMPRAGTIGQLRVHYSAAEGVAATFQVTLEDSTTAESLTCTVGNSATTCSDSTVGHYFAFAAGDLLSWQTIQTGTGTNAFVIISALIW